LTYIEYESNTVDGFEGGEFAPPSETVIPQIFFNWDETFGDLPSVKYDFVEYTVAEMEPIIQAENVLIEEWTAEMDDYEVKVNAYNEASNKIVK
jgi:hypothetical protein